MKPKNKASRKRRIATLGCIVVLTLSVLPLYAISFYNHPYYDDFNFSAGVHSVWQETGSLSAVLTAAWAGAKEVRATWQGTYTGTLLSNIQPGVFDEGLYFIGSLFILTAFLLCFGYFFVVAFGRDGLGLDRQELTALSCLSMALMVQLMPDAGEAFFWFNGGIGNVFIYSLMALTAGLLIKLYRAQSARSAVGSTALLALLMVALGGGSYSGGLMGLCGLALAALWLFMRKHPLRWNFLGLWCLLLGCFVYSMTAPGNTVRAGVIGYQGSMIKTIAQALYYGTAKMGGYLRLPLIGLTVIMLPAFCRAAKASPWRFEHPWLVILTLGCLFCTQLAPPLYSGVFIGGTRTEDTYWLSFVMMWLIAAYYLAGHLVRRVTLPRALPAPWRRGVALAGVALVLAGCLGYKQDEDKLYGLQNMAGVSAAISLINGEAAQYDREMTAREALLNDPSLPSVTLAPLTVVPKVFMDDLIVPDALYDARPALCAYYGKTSIAIEGEEAAHE